MEDQTWPAKPIYSRRRILALGGAAAAAAAILAACGSDDDASDATTAPAGDTTAPAPDSHDSAGRHRGTDPGRHGRSADLGACRNWR